MKTPPTATLPALLLHLGVLLLALPRPASGSPYVVTFDRQEYQIRAGATFPVQVHISPAVPGGVFSFGVMLMVDSTNATVAGASAIAVPPALHFDGPRAAVPVVATGPGFAAVKGTGEFFSPVLTTSSNTLLATFYVSDRGNGPYELRLGFFNTLGSTEQIFVNGSGTVLDPQITFATAAVVQVGGLTNEVRSGLTLNRQTGLFEQTVRVINNSLNPVNGVRLFVNLTTNWTVWNAAGTTNGRPFLQHAFPIAPGGFVDLRVEYRIPNRIPSPQPGYEAVPFDPPGTTPPVGTPFPVSPRHSFADGSFLLEFNSLSNRFYSIQYSYDLQTWQTVLPAVKGNGSRLQWIDYGPPKTDSPPTARPQRYYRVFLLAQ